MQIKLIAAILHLIFNNPLNMTSKFLVNQVLCGNIAFNVQNPLNMTCKSPVNQVLCSNIAFNIQDPLNMTCKS
uniref:Uncharacterized protein n=1 Tax=viral metagenome TaxID=1070528 RepID=A0A6C0CAF0_9ZZZZ